MGRLHALLARRTDDAACATSWVRASRRRPTVIARRNVLYEERLDEVHRSRMPADSYGGSPRNPLAIATGSGGWR